MEADTRPQPLRFQGAYVEATDGSGFTLSENGCFYAFDKHKGWYDEFGNYYNCDGEVDDPPEDSLSSSYFSHSSHSESEDEFQREFGAPHQESSSSEEEDCKHRDQMADNLLRLQQYPLKTPLRLHFLGNTVQKARLFQEATKKGGEGVLNVLFTSGIQQGYFVVDGLETALHLIKLESGKLGCSTLTFQLDPYESFLLLPLQPLQLIYCPPNKYVLKNNQHDVKPSQKPSSEWLNFTFQKKAFQNRTHFKKWMSDYGFNIDQDYGQIKKLNSNPNLIQVPLTSHVFNTMHGKQYNGIVILFTKLDLQN